MSYGSSKWQDWVLDEREAKPFFKKAIDLGINFFDTADVYSLGRSEEITGKALKEFTNRDGVIIATKVQNRVGNRPNDEGLSRKHILDSIDMSLQRLGTDYVDLYQIHRWDYETPIEETLEALNDIVRWGKARYIGVSSMFAWQFAKLLFTADLNKLTRPISMQNHYNLLYREEEREMLPLCIDQNIGVVVWSPLARGLLTANKESILKNHDIRFESDKNLKKWYSEVNLDILDDVDQVSQKTQNTPSQVALNWLFNKKIVSSVIVGATRIEYLDEIVSSLDVKLQADEIELIERKYRPISVQGHS
jgi:aryl-alcohol dehydrogenase (NADP+)